MTVSANMLSYAHNAGNTISTVSGQLLGAAALAPGAGVGRSSASLKGNRTSGSSLILQSFASLLVSEWLT